MAVTVSSLWLRAGAKARLIRRRARRQVRLEPERALARRAHDFGVAIVGAQGDRAAAIGAIDAQARQGLRPVVATAVGSSAGRFGKPDRRLTGPGQLATFAPLLLFGGEQFLHQIRPFQQELDRVSITVHAAEVDRGVWETWF